MIAMTKVERRVNFIVNNSRLEGLHHTPEEVERIRRVVSGKMSCDSAVKEVIALHEKK